MNGSIDSLLDHPVSFLSTPVSRFDDIAISSRVRLARNLAARPFPVAATPEQRREVCELAEKTVLRKKVLGPAKKVMVFKPEELSENDRMILLERRLASRDFIENPENTALLVCPEERCSIMVNEEDQLRLQSLRPGLQLEEAYREISRIDDLLSEELDFAFDEKIGYLTACPTNVGTGMRASVMLHLPALTKSGQITPTIHGISKLHLAVRGIFGEGTETSGNLYQISNQYTLGESEEKLIANLHNVIIQLINHEKKARALLLEKERYSLLDHVGRAYGTLRYSYRLSEKEALQNLSAVRLGVDLGLFSKVDIGKINEMFINIGSAHLKKSLYNTLENESPDIIRALVCRSMLKQPSSDS